MKIQLTKIKPGKFLLIILLTVLIWVWADLAQDEHINHFATLVFDRSSSSKLLVTVKGRPTVDVKLFVSGPHQSILELNRTLKDSQILTFDLDISSVIQKAGNYDLPLLSLLQKDASFARTGLKILSCQPSSISIDVSELVLSNLAIRCTDSDDNIITSATVEPVTVEAYIPSDWPESKQFATVTLTSTELLQSKHHPITKSPTVEFSPFVHRTLTSKVNVVALVQNLQSYTIGNATVGLLSSVNMHGNYKVEFANSDQVMGSISIRASAEATDAYRNQRFQVVLMIDDKDKDAAGIMITRPLQYNFPDEYLRLDQIVLNQQPVIAEFKLVPIEPAQ